MSIQGTDITVIGAGIAGLAAATALAQRGAVVTVLEQASELGEVGAGLQVGPNGISVLEALGLRDAAEPLANVPEAVILRDMLNGRQVARLPMGAAATQRWGRPYWQFHRADLLDVLANGAREAGVNIRLDERVEGADASIIIAADGVRSNIRKTVFDGQPVQFTGHVAWRGVLKGTVENAATVYMAPGKHLVTYPLRDDLVNFVAVEERSDWTDEGWSVPDDPENLRAAFADATPEIRALLDQVDETFLWGLFDHPVLPNWTKDNVALIGDACHPMLPFLAQGAVMALEDAWVLACELNRNGVAGLQEYERLRKPRATRVQKVALGNARAYHLRGVQRSIAHKGLAAISTLAPQLLLGKFDWLYGEDVTIG